MEHVWKNLGSHEAIRIVLRAKICMEKNVLTIGPTVGLASDLSSKLPWLIKVLRVFRCLQSHVALLGSVRGISQSLFRPSPWTGTGRALAMPG